MTFLHIPQIRHRSDLIGQKCSWLFICAVLARSVVWESSCGSFDRPRPHWGLQFGGVMPPKRRVDFITDAHKAYHVQLK